MNTSEDILNNAQKFFEQIKQGWEGNRSSKFSLAFILKYKL